MNSNRALEKLLHSFESYYTISTKDVSAPFAAEAVFNSHGEKYFLVRAAKLADIDSNEFVFFYCSEKEELDFQKVTELASSAWERGLSRVNAYYGHRNTDISLFILSDKLSQTALKKIKKINFYKSYKFGLYGWSRFKIIAADFSSSLIACNSFGAEFKKVLLPILKAESRLNTEEYDSSVI